MSPVHSNLDHAPDATSKAWTTSVAPESLAPGIFECQPFSSAWSTSPGKSNSSLTYLHGTKILPELVEVWDSLARPHRTSSWGDHPEPLHLLHVTTWTSIWSAFEAHVVAASALSFDVLRFQRRWIGFVHVRFSCRNGSQLHPFASSIAASHRLVPRTEEHERSIRRSASRERGERVSATRSRWISFERERSGPGNLSCAAVVVRHGTCTLPQTSYRPFEADVCRSTRWRVSHTCACREMPKHEWPRPPTTEISMKVGERSRYESRSRARSRTKGACPGDVDVPKGRVDRRIERGGVTWSADADRTVDVPAGASSPGRIHGWEGGIDPAPPHRTVQNGCGQGGVDP